MKKIFQQTTSINFIFMSLNGWFFFHEVEWGWREYQEGNCQQEKRRNRKDIKLCDVDENGSACSFPTRHDTFNWMLGNRVALRSHNVCI